MTDEPTGIMRLARRASSAAAAPIIPVVRLHGVIAADPRPGRLNIANVAPLLEARLRHEVGPRRRHHRQFARRLARPVAPHRQAHPRPRRRARQARARLRRGRRGLGRLLHRHRRRRDHRRSLLDRRLDRRHLRRLRLRRGARQARRRAPRPHRRQEQVDLDPFLPEKAEDVERIKTARDRHPPGLHRLGEVAPRRQAHGAPTTSSSPASSGPACAASSSASSTPSATCTRPCAPAIGDKVRTQGHRAQARPVPACRASASALRRRSHRRRRHRGSRPLVAARACDRASSSAS